MPKTIVLALVCIACSAATPERIGAISEACPIALATTPFVQSEAAKLGIAPLEYARTACNAGTLVIAAAKPVPAPPVCPLPILGAAGAPDWLPLDVAGRAGQ
jgi:hypothetical protein